jgi:hypothetical protein
MKAMSGGGGVREFLTAGSGAWRRPNGQEPAVEELLLRLRLYTSRKRNQELLFSFYYISSSTIHDFSSWNSLTSHTAAVY